MLDTNRPSTASARSQRGEFRSEGQRFGALGIYRLLKYGCGEAPEDSRGGGMGRGTDGTSGPVDRGIPAAHGNRAKRTIWGGGGGANRNS